MALSLSDCLFATVAYADIFSYPMTRDDLYLWCIQKKPVKNFRTTSIHHVQYTKDFFILKGRNNIISLNATRYTSSQKKWKTAKTVGNILRWIPSVRLVGVTGGLSMNNADKTDDIDMFFIVSTGALWITRLIIIMIVDRLGIRRRPGQGRVANTVCLNMFMTEDALMLPKHEQDLFSAHEVLQMAPLWYRGDVYQRFIYNNTWTKKFLPTAWKVKYGNSKVQKQAFSLWENSVIVFMKIFDLPAKLAQIWYMAPKRTHEVISDTMLRFHPNDARAWVLPQLKKRLKLCNVPLDNIFYAR